MRYEVARYQIKPIQSVATDRDRTGVESESLPILCLPAFEYSSRIKNVPYRSADRIEATVGMCKSWPGKGDGGRSCLRTLFIKLRGCCVLHFNWCCSSCDRYLGRTFPPDVLLPQVLHTTALTNGQPVDALPPPPFDGTHSTKLGSCGFHASPVFSDYTQSLWYVTTRLGDFLIKPCQHNADLLLT